MTDNEVLMHLAGRVEASSGPDRELDALIWWECGDGKRLCPEDTTAGRAVRNYFGADFDDDGNFRPETTATYRGLAYTASIDAAIQLVPEGIGDGITALWNVEVWADNGVYPEHVRATAWVYGAARTYAATPALALTAAALRARASKETGYRDFTVEATDPASIARGVSV